MAINKRAIVFGINYYDEASLLGGCVNDAKKIGELLKRNNDNEKSKNFDVEIFTAENKKSSIKRRDLMDKVQDLFSQKYEIALFYFSGHGSVTSTGGYLITSECKNGDEGLSTAELMYLANNSPSTNKIIILDCCHSGIAGNTSPKNDQAALNPGVTILAASGKDQYSMETNGSGVYTTLLADALEGGAANLLGEITPGSVYAHIDQSLAANQQRPLFKTHVDSFISLRKIVPPISLSDLHMITTLFPDKDYEFSLDPTFEPNRDQPIDIPPIKENTDRFAILQKYNRMNLLVPETAHMWDAAIYSKSCKLTVLGKHYWSLVKKERI